MSRPKKLRLLFDLAGLLGLVMLGLSLWFGHPHPKWRVPLGPTFTPTLGFSANNQSVYTIIINSTQGSRIPKPILQRWEVATGILEAEYPLVFPAEDLDQVKADQATSQSFSYRVHLYPDNLLYVDTPAGVRFYDVEKGRCISQQPMKVDWIWYLMQNPEDQHYWGMAVSSTDKEGAKAVLYDLTKGEVLHTFVHSSTYQLYGSRSSADRHYILMLWGNDPQEKSLPSFEVEIIQTGNWKSLVRLPSKDPGGYGVGPLLQPNLLVQTSYFKENDLSKKRLECFRFDPEKGTLKPEENHPFHGLVCSELISVQNDLLLRHGIRGTNQPNLPWWKSLWNAIENSVREGKLPEAAQQDFFVYDFNTGRPLRQLTGLTGFGNQALALHLSHDMRYVMGTEQGFLTLYEIPHHLWERTWNVLFYISIFMIFLWPFRLLRKRIPLEPRPIPTP